VLTASFGSTRRFELLHVRSKSKIKLELEHGSLFVLGPLSNAQYKHSIVKETSKKVAVGERISLTYRNIQRYINQVTGQEVAAPVADQPTM
jgi:alkylated DNA repair dioxygenase AlkB